MNKTYFNWSTGKDSALALYHLLQSNEHHVDQLLTSVNAAFDRVSMHGLRRALLEAQVKSLGIPCDTIELPESPNMETYGKLMREGVERLRSRGYTKAGFGDIFLEDLKEYREKQLAQLDVACIFPLWKRDTREIMEEFLSLGFKAIVICINNQVLDESYVGRELDGSFLNDLPENVDPCGENGEFHTFCYDGPIFKNPIQFAVGEKTYREYPAPNEDAANYGYWFCDLLSPTN